MKGVREGGEVFRDKMIDMGLFLCICVDYFYDLWKNIMFYL